jgi:hypothetical protein
MSCTFGQAVGVPVNLFLFFTSVLFNFNYWPKQIKAMQACNFARDKPVSTDFFLFDERG